MSFSSEFRARIVRNVRGLVNVYETSVGNRCLERTQTQNILLRDPVTLDIM